MVYLGMKTFTMKIIARFSRPTDDITRSEVFKVHGSTWKILRKEFKVANKMTDVVQA